MSDQPSIKAVADTDEMWNQATLWTKCQLLNRAVTARWLLNAYRWISSQEGDIINSEYLTDENREAFKDDPSTLIECEKGFDEKDLTVTNDCLVSNFEREHYYHGVYPAVLKLFYCSNLESNPFTHPSPRDTQSHVPVKTMGSYPWRQDIQNMKYDIGVALREHPRVVFENIGIVMFSSRHAGGTVTFSPLTIHVVCDIANTGATEACEASLHVLCVVKKHDLPDFENAVVEWVEASDEDL